MRNIPEYSKSKLLYSGKCMSQPAFHAAYEAMPAGYRAELIGGVVHEPSPVSCEHGEHHARLIFLLALYSGPYSGLHLGDNTTVILGMEDEVQPDAFLRINPGFGGNTKNTRTTSGSKRTYVEGPPELVAEVAASNKDVDLQFKKGRYAHAGGLEYMVLCLDPQQLFWFDLPGNCLRDPDSEGIFRSKVFPGLWIDGGALLQLDYQRSVDVLNAGIKSPGYAEFMANLTRIDD